MRETIGSGVGVLLGGMLLLGCGAPEHGGNSEVAGTCVPPGLEAAHEVEIVRLPAGCSFGASGELTAPRVVSDADALASVMTCPPGVAVPAIDLSDTDLMLVTFQMSPAFGGIGVVDDGTTVTYVMRDRPPCPDDPMPMPMPSSVLAYRLPKAATRAYRQLACSLPRTCS